MVKPVTDLIPRDARKNRVIVCEGLNFFWDEPELKQLAMMWKRCDGIEIIAKYFKRDPDEIIIALIHLARNDKINRRKGGLLL
jgi:ABC-type ATPase with predicted acetyltransferase domain